MANSNLFHYIIIISIANAVSPILGQLQYQQAFPGRFLHLYDTHKHPDTQMNRHGYPPLTSYNPQPPPKNLLQSDTEGRTMRNLGYKVICEMLITTVEFKEEGYDFYPSVYVNKSCVETSADPYVSEYDGIKKPEVCLHNDDDFGCQTQYDYLNVLKKSKDGNTECSVHTTQLVAVGCKCNVHFMSYN